MGHGHVARWDGYRRPGYRLIWADGYYGPGYYYGPPGRPYYGSGVAFYSRLGDAPASIRVSVRG